ncbi:MAG: glucose-6-phosphate isomerase, partial [Thaumarchaeota archaeon]|nr:glucose-6-phosphate isomerase [Nitrososphaerota archaeon]
MSDINKLLKYDKNNIHKVYDIWPEIAKEHYEKNLDKASFKGIEDIIFVGMGGSGAIGDTLLSVMSKTKMYS